MTMKTELVKLLHRRWTTPLDALQRVGCLSLSQRCSELRRDGVLVLDKWVELPNGKRVKSYRIFGVGKSASLIA